MRRDLISSLTGTLHLEKVNDLPPSGLAGSGWPSVLPGHLSSGFHQKPLLGCYPKISIITPSYNQSKYIEATIRSVLMQGYPNLEYIIIDGGSKDGSVDIIKKYARYIHYWVSEPDEGQAHAINKGLNIATGDILAYINSDDYYLPGALIKVAEFFYQEPDTDLLNGKCNIVDETGAYLYCHMGQISNFVEVLNLWKVWWGGRQFIQPEIFWSRKILKKIGGFRQSLHYVMDYEFWVRAFRCSARLRSINEELACFRYTPYQKTQDKDGVARELLEVAREVLWDPTSPIPFIKRFSLQGDWLYHQKMLLELNRSINANDSKMIRWAKAMKVILKNPQIFASSFFIRRVQSLFQREKAKGGKGISCP